MDNKISTGETTILCTPSTEILRDIKTRTVASLSLISGPQSGSFYYLTSNNELILGSSIEATIQISDQGVSRKHIRFYFSNDDAFIEDLESANGSYLNGTKITSATSVKDGDQIAIGASTVIKFNISNKLDAEYQQHIADQLTRDSLTNALNKRTFIQVLHQEYLFAKRHSLAVCVLFIDIDRFKDINDTYGHLLGDEILKHIYNLLHQNSRTDDYVYRFGGEEFTIICRNLTTHEGLQYAERIRSYINSSPYNYDSQSIEITVSIGVSSYPEDGTETIAELVKSADDAMYQAKSMGRNKVIANTNQAN